MFSFAAAAPLTWVPVLMWRWSDREEDYVLRTFCAFAAIPFSPLLTWCKNPLRRLAPLISRLFPLIGTNALTRWLVGSNDE